MQWRFLKGEPLPKLSFEAFAIEIDFKGNNEALWNLHQDVILAEHVKTSPGTRPALWWKYTAPRLPIGTFPGCYYDGQLPEPRKRVGGTGTPAHEVRAVVPSFSYGIADVWVDIDDEDDLPTFESQAAYLKRHGLFLAGEEKRSDFEEEFVPKSWDYGI
jgi:hypothetical protein